MRAGIVKGGCSKRGHPLRNGVEIAGNDEYWIIDTLFLHGRTGSCVCRRCGLALSKGCLSVDEHAGAVGCGQVLMKRGFEVVYR